ncbi:MAG: Kelch repeat-containing protein [Candidatus Thorarchaeota archaeon]
MRKSKVLSNLALLSAFFIFMITIVPLCTVDTVHLNPILQTEGNSNITVIEEYSETILSDDPQPEPLVMAYDSESDRTILFGYSNETWAYDYNSRTWTNLTTTTHPRSEYHASMAYDSESDRIVYFGESDETWAYDYNSNTWTNLTTATTPGGGSMAYDSESDVIILYGETSNSIATWSYDFNSNSWTNMSPTIQPSGASSNIVYDSESDRVILFDGSLDPLIRNETWSYDYNSNTWTEMSPAANPPSRRGGEMVYDIGSDRIILFGGYTGGYVSFPSFADTWSYDYNSDTWTQMTPESHPSGRTGHGFVYDSESDKIILFGGYRVYPAGYGMREDAFWTYDYDENFWNNMDWDWQEMTPTVSPAVTNDPAMAYDIESDLVVMFGGGETWMMLHNGMTIWGYNETWTYNYNTNTWTNMSPSIAPVLRVSTEMAYDVESDIIILFGGIVFDAFLGSYLYNDTWAYDVNTNTWTNMTPAVGPSARTGHSMTYDSKSDRIILFGGYNWTGGSNYMNDTWT